MPSDSHLLTRFISGLHLSEELTRKFMESGKITHFKRKDYIIRQGELCCYVIGVLHGDVKFCWCNPDGEEQVLGYTFTQKFATDYPSFLQRKPANYSIQAINDCILFLISYEQIMSIFEYSMEGQRFGRQIAEILLIKRERSLLSFHTNSPEERYIKLMEHYRHLEKPITLKEIASIIGVTPETVSRIRKKILLDKKS